MYKSRLFLLLFIIFTSTVKVSAQCTAAVNGSVYLVTTNADGGPGSLRQAILDANAANVGGAIYTWGPVLYDFPIYSPLPTVTCDSLIILQGGTLFRLDGQGSIQEPGYVIVSNSSCLDGVTGINFLPATFTVTNTNDDGIGSLRRAIETSNFSASADNIVFNIPGLAPHAIHPVTQLPDIKHSLTINGTSQPPNGFTGSGPTIELDGVINGFPGLDIDCDDIDFHFSVFGMYIHGFNTGIRAHNGIVTGLFNIGSNQHRRNVVSGNIKGIYIYNDSIIVENTWIGTDTSGTVDEGNSFSGLELIGNTCILHNNLISGNDSLGAYIDANSYVNVKGNIIGSDKTGNAAIPNQVGISIWDAEKIIFGGPNNGDGNLVSGNTFLSAELTGDTIIFCGNKFGTDISGTDTISGGSSMNGAYFWGQNVRIGGPTLSEGNIFAGPGDVGVRIDPSDSLVFMNNFVGTGLNGTGVFPFNIGIKARVMNGTNHQLYSGNIIANNSYGIILDPNNPNTGTIVNNEIYNNSLYGIWNHDDFQLITANSIYNNGKGIENDPGANNSIAQPFINYADNSNISGTAEPFATIELFYNLSFNANPQGYTMIGSVTADANGNWLYQGVITNPTNVTTTQTDTIGNTSEFSPLWIPSGIHPDSEKSSFQLYPNPAIDAVYITFSTRESRTISFQDITGSVVLNMVVPEQQTQINVRNMPAGIYLVEIMDVAGNISRTHLVIGNGN